MAQAEFSCIKAYGHHTIEEEKRGEQQTHSESFTLIVTKRLRSKREAVSVENSQSKYDNPVMGFMLRWSITQFTTTILRYDISDSTFSYSSELSKSSNFLLLAIYPLIDLEPFK